MHRKKGEKKGEKNKTKHNNTGAKKCAEGEKGEGLGEGEGDKLVKERGGDEGGGGESVCTEEPFNIKEVCDEGWRKAKRFLDKDAVGVRVRGRGEMRHYESAGTTHYRSVQR